MDQSVAMPSPVAAPDIAHDSPPVKQEVPSAASAIAENTPQHPSPKRRRTSSDGTLHNSDADADTYMYAKRQRVETGTLATDDLAAIIAQATASATQQFEAQTQLPQPQASPAQTYSSQDSSYGQFSGRTDAHGNEHLTDPHHLMRIESLPVLENLSTLLLSKLAQGPYSHTIRIITEPNSDVGQAYVTLKALFDQTKKMYTQMLPFLSADELNIQEAHHRATIRTTNIATFVASVFGGQDVGFFELNDNFIETFTPEGEQVQKDVANLYLNFKTQMYLSAMSSEEQEHTKEETLEDLFPDSIDGILLARHPDKPLSQSESEFAHAIRGRRQFLMNEPSDIDSIQVLSDRFAWEDFLRNLSIYLSKNYAPLLDEYHKRHALPVPAAPDRTPQASSSESMDAQQNSPTKALSSRLTADDIATQARLAAEAALQSAGYGQDFSIPQRHGGSQQHSFQQEAQSSTYLPEYNGSAIPYPTQTAPTQVLYEQARQAAVAKANPSRGRPGLPSQRRPWSSEEENALMAGLDQVKGPHWSQILALYGTKGQINEVLKDRNQVQLKDKARNLKLFFLKSNIEVPYYLQCVTGELKTRAPSQAARKEAEERARLATDEERARYNGIMALARGMHGDGQGEGQNEEDEEEEDDSISGGEIFDVVEPEIPGQEPQSQPQELPASNPVSQQLSEDDQFRQQLMAATAAGNQAALNTTAI